MHLHPCIPGQSAPVCMSNHSKFLKHVTIMFPKWIQICTSSTRLPNMVKSKISLSYLNPVKSYSRLKFWAFPVNFEKRVWFFFMRMSLDEPDFFITQVICMKIGILTKWRLQISHITSIVWYLNVISVCKTAFQKDLLAIFGSHF